MSSAEQQPADPDRLIKPTGALAIVAGSMLGIGIFLSPPIVATHVDSVWLFVALWLLGGIVSLSGAVACAELGTLIPKAGGDYVFQRAAFGPSVAFASGWVLFVAIFSGSIATMSVGICTYQAPVLLGIDLSAFSVALPLGMSLNGVDLAAIVVILALTGLNIIGTAPTTRTQVVLTVVPVALLTGAAIYALLFYSAPAETGDAAGAYGPPWSLAGIVVSYMAVYFAYSGWINIIYVAGEVDVPSRNIPLSLIAGTFAVMVLYILVCAGMLQVLGMDGLREAGEAGTAVAGVLGGHAGELVATVLIACALLASINGTILGGARVAFAMGRDGAMWPILGTVDTQHHVPSRALWLQAILSIALVLSGRFEELYTMVSLAMVITGTLTVASLFALRLSEPDRERPYRATGYPWFPGLYIVSSIFVVVVMARDALSGTPGAAYPFFGLGVLVTAYVWHRFFGRALSRS